jgi:enoyl-CoA hydratase/carnithine racemase
MSEAFGPWTLQDDGQLAVLTVSKPPLNLFDREVEQGLRDAVDRLTAEPPRALLLRAQGRVWTGGVDVNLFAELDPESGAELWQRGFELVHQLEDLPCPVVFAAHALCLTWGLEIALACDLLVAAESAQFGLVETRVGLTPSMGGPQRLAERAGPARARELIFTGERYPAAVLERWNVVNRVLPDDGFADAARAYAHRVAAGPTVAHAATKRLVATSMREGARAADAMVPEVSGALFATEDLRGAVASFLTDGPGKATYSGR